MNIFLKQLFSLLFALHIHSNFCTLIAMERCPLEDSSDSEDEVMYKKVKEHNETFYISVQDDKKFKNSPNSTLTFLIIQNADGTYTQFTPPSSYDKSQIRSFEEFKAICTQQPAPADFMAFLELEKTTEERIDQAKELLIASETKKVIEEKLSRINSHLAYLRQEEVLTKYPYLRPLDEYYKVFTTPTIECAQENNPVLQAHSEFEEWNQAFKQGKKPHDAETENNLRDEINRRNDKSALQHKAELQQKKQELEAILKQKNPHLAFESWCQKEEEERYTTTVTNETNYSLENHIPRYKFDGFDQQKNKKYTTPIFSLDKQTWHPRTIYFNTTKDKYMLEDTYQEKKQEDGTIRLMHLEEEEAPADFYAFHDEICKGEQCAQEAIQTLCKVNEQQHALYAAERDLFETKTKLKECKYKLDIIDELRPLQIPELPLISDFSEEAKKWEADFAAGRVLHDVEKENTLRVHLNDLRSHKTQKQILAEYNELLQIKQDTLKNAGISIEEFKERSLAPIVKPSLITAATAPTKTPHTDPKTEVKTEENLLVATLKHPITNRRKALALYGTPTVLAIAAHAYHNYVKKLPQGKKPMNFGAYCLELIKKPRKNKLFTTALYAVVGGQIGLGIYDAIKKQA